jgi:hypothetical protein
VAEDNSISTKVIRGMLGKLNLNRHRQQWRRSLAGDEGPALRPGTDGLRNADPRWFLGRSNCGPGKSANQRQRTLPWWR